MRPALALAFSAFAAACATPEVQPFGPEVATARIESRAIRTGDGYRLPLEVWEAEKPEAILIALHGFNDYRRAIRPAARWWAARGITTYAFDQRGFGETAKPGVWGGRAALAADAGTAVALVRARHPGLPVHLLGISMGGAVALLAAADGAAADGLILAAPATWGGRAMNPLYRALLWLWTRLTPAGAVSGRGLGRLASDNIEMLRGLGRDPLVIKQTRVDALYGLTRTMGEALEVAGRVETPILLLYGAHDEIIPPGPIDALRSALKAPTRLVVYPDGWHMLLRDCGAETVWRDVAAWAVAPEAALPSGAEVDPAAALPWAGIGERSEVSPTCPDAEVDEQAAEAS